MDDLKYIGNQIRQHRKDAKLTLMALHRLTGMSVAGLSRIERGHDLRISQLLRIARALNAEPARLLPPTEVVNPN